MRELFDKGNEAIAGRSVWEQKQRLYSQMRHEGLRRRNKPFPTASDLHFPLVDMNIRKAKPFYQAQATSGDRLASFVALQDQDQAITDAAADFYDFELRENSNFLVELIRMIDVMALRGRGVLKVVTDPFEDQRIVAKAIDSMFILMADGADDFEDADWFIHVQHFSVAGYERSRRFSMAPEVLSRIRGSKDLDTSSGLLQDKQAREGVNYSKNPDQIILWEHWVKTLSGWTIYTYSPLAPDAEVRKPFSCPYKIGSKASCPFFSFPLEIKDAGWFSPRGMGELGAPFEAYVCKLWNEKVDSMTYGNRPVFTSEQQIPNSANLRWNPGEFIPGNIKPVQMAQPPFSFDQEIGFARSTSEQQNMLPDFGITQPGQGPAMGGPRTATENNRIANLQSVGTDAGGFVFHLSLAKVHRHNWGLMVQFKRRKMIYFAGKELKTLPEEALHEVYLVRPGGAPDDWNKQQRLQRAVGRLQTYANAPNVDQDVLVRDALAADSPKLALEAFVPTNVKAASEAEDEAVEIMILKDGFPAQVKSNEDHATRIHVLLGWLQKQGHTGQPFDPVAQQRVSEHMAAHFQMLQQINPQQARQVAQQIQQAEQQPAGPPGPGQPGPPQPGAESMGGPS